MPEPNTDRRAYRRRLFREALRGTEIKWLRNITVTLCAGFAVARLKVGAVNETTLLWTWLFAATFFVVWESLAFMYRRFYVAPFDEHHRQHDEVGFLKSELATLGHKRANAELAARLSQRLEYLLNHLRQKNTRPNTTEQWAKALDVWRDEVIEIMKQAGCSEPEIASIRTLGELAQYNPTNRRFSGSGDKQRIFVRIDAYRQRLEPIIQRYDE